MYLQLYSHFAFTCCIQSINIKYARPHASAQPFHCDYTFTLHSVSHSFQSTNRWQLAYERTSLTTYMMMRWHPRMVKCSVCFQTLLQFTQNVLLFAIHAKTASSPRAFTLEQNHHGQSVIFERKKYDTKIPCCLNGRYPVTKTKKTTNAVTGKWTGEIRAANNFHRKPKG